MIPWIIVGLNIVSWFIIFIVQNWESQKGLIPQRKKWDINDPKKSFLYLQDWFTGTWGDLFGLSFVAWAFGASVDVWSGADAFVALAISLAITYCLHLIWKNGLPNAGYPDRGTISLSGRTHLAYTSVLVFITAYLFLILLMGKVSAPAMLAATFGIMIYMISLIFDYKEGKFSR